MNQQTYLESIINSFYDLKSDDFKKYLIGGLAAVAILSFGALFYIRTTSSALSASIKNLHKLAAESDNLINQYEKIKKEEDDLAQLLEKNKDFTSLKSYFEQFIKQNQLTPEAGWAETATIIPSAEIDKFEKEEIEAVFKNKTTQQVVQLIDVIEKNPMIHLSQVTITPEGHALTAALTISAMRESKKSLEE